MYHSTLGVRVMKKKKARAQTVEVDVAGARMHLAEEQHGHDCLICDMPVLFPDMTVLFVHGDRPLRLMWQGRACILHKSRTPGAFELFVLAASPPVKRFRGEGWWLER